MEPSRAVDAVRLLGAVLEDSPHNRQSMVQISGVLTLICFVSTYSNAASS